WSLLQRQPRPTLFPYATLFRSVERFGPVASLLACWLETGRTHQIRIHMAEMGHPVVGEKVYRPMNQPSCKAKFHRQALHAQTLRSEEHTSELQSRSDPVCRLLL